MKINHCLLFLVVGCLVFFYSFCSLIFHCLFSCRFFGNHKLPFHTAFYSCFPFLRCPLACTNFAFCCRSRSGFFFYLFSYYFTIFVLLLVRVFF